MKSYSTILTIAFATHIVVLGINCRGSFVCNTGAITCGIADLQDQVNMLDDDASFGPGEHIACCDHLCAFTQNTGENTDGANAKQLIAAVRNHGCARYESAPFSDNDISEGELTVNYVADEARQKHNSLL